MAKRTPGRGARAWQVESVWVKRREGPARVLSAYRLLLDLHPGEPYGGSIPWVARFGKKGTRLPQRKQLRRPPSRHQTTGHPRQSREDTSLLDWLLLLSALNPERRSLMHVALYARVSTGRQEREQTITSQLSALRLWVAEQGHEVHPDHIYCDEGWSGARLDRPALDRLRDAAHEGAFAVVAVWSPDRLARKYAYQVLLVEDLLTFSLPDIVRLVLRRLETQESNEGYACSQSQIARRKSH